MKTDHLNDMKKSLSGCFKGISSLIKRSNNRILILDYTYCILENDSPIDIRSFYFEAVPSYNKLLYEFIQSNGNSIGLTKNKSIETLSNNSNNTITPLKRYSFDTYKSEESTNFNVTSIKSWHKFCANKGLGGFLMTIFYRVSPNHLIGVYLVLQNPIDNGFEGKTIVLGISDLIKDYLMTEGWAITYSIVSDPVLRSLLQTDLGVRKAQDIELEELRCYKDEIAHNGHTIFNLLPDSLLGIDILKNKIHRNYSTDIEMNNLIIREQKRLTLTNIICQMISRREVTLLAQKTICQLLELLRDNEPVKNVNLSFVDIKSVDYVPTKNNFYNSNVNRAFTVLWNLWHNASQYSSCDYFDVNVFNFHEILCIEFVNYGKQLQDQNIQFLLGNMDSAVSQRGIAGGLSIIKNTMKEINWKIDLVSSENNGVNNLWKTKIRLLSRKM